MLTSTKWGLRLHLDSAVGNKAARRVPGRSCAGQAGGLNESSTKCPGTPLDEQIRAGNVTITNQYALLRGSYEYFCERAEQRLLRTRTPRDRPTMADLIGGQGAQ